MKQNIPDIGSATRSEKTKWHIDLIDSSTGVPDPVSGANSILLTYVHGRFEWRGGYETRKRPKGAGFLWDPWNRCWYTESFESAAKLIAHADKVAAARISMAGTKASREKAKRLAASLQTASNYEAPAPEGLSYLPYQKVVYEYVRTAKGERPGVLLADQMGLGKTVMALGAINDNADFRRVLVVCPACLKLNWAREAQKWLVRAPRIVILTAADRRLPQEGEQLAVINYDIVHKLRPLLDSLAWDLVVLDESHHLNNGKAQRTKSLLGGSAGKSSRSVEPLGARFWFFLSGTPLLNRPRELWTTLKKLDPFGLGRDWLHYHRRYCAGKLGRYGWEIDGASNLEELESELRSSIMIRRCKEDVLAELPGKRRRIIPLEAQSTDARKLLQSQKTLQEKAESLQAQISAMSKKIKGKKADNALGEKAIIAALCDEVSAAFGELSRLRAQLGKTKAEECLPLLVEAARQQPVLIFCHHHGVIDLVAEGLAKEEDLRVAKIDGRDDLGKRQATVDAFQAGKIDALVLQIQSCGLGLTLTRACHVIFLEQDWTPGRMAQAEDRVHRIGQILPVLIDVLVYDGTLDARMAKTLAEKQTVITQTLDGSLAKTCLPKKCSSEPTEDGKS